MERNFVVSMRIDLSSLTHYFLDEINERFPSLLPKSFFENKERIVQRLSPELERNGRIQNCEILVLNFD